LRIHDGSDAPLDLARVEARFPTPEVYVVAPPGRYALLLGYPEASAPAYELARVREVVLAVRSNTVSPGPLEENPDFSSSARLARGGGPQQVLLWAALILAVVVLAVITLRMTRQNTPPAGNSE
jgi:hypothetical protein